MAENKDLYFIPIIARALESDDPERAMKDAFDEISALGTEPNYNRGFLQFQQFVKAALQPSGPESPKIIQIVREAIYRLIYDLATETYEGTNEQRDQLISTLKSQPEWNAQYERIKTEFQDLLPPEGQVTIEILRDENLLGSSTISADAIIFKGIEPGNYVVRLSTGRVLWDGKITAQDVLWAYAFPGKDLPMAAETESTHQDPTKVESLLDGELLMSLFAGLESGMIRLEFPKGTR